jgi:hypothetical protein
MKNNNNKWLLAAGFVSVLATTAANAGSFEVAVSPSRFEVTANAGKRLGQSIEIQNVGTTPTEVALRTLDWTYSPDGNITYYDELLPGSCRPWVTLERTSLTVAARNKKSFRFQLDVPANTPRSECRFMVAVEGVEPAHQALIESAGASLSLPVTGRIAVAVYVAVNGAESKLEMQQVSVQNIKGKRTPVAVVSNTGDSHGRLEGALTATDAQGQSVELVPEGTPILPGQTRTIPLMPQGVDNQPAPALAFPLKSNGTLDWEGGSFKVDAVFK